MLDNDVTPARKQVGRRAVTRGAAWSVPVVTLAMAAPANAVTSGACTPTTGLLDWDVFTDGTRQTGKALVTSGGTGVTVTVAVSGDTGADNNGEVTSTSTGGQSKVLRLYDENRNKNTAQTVTITFSKSVTGVGFSFLDIDSETGGGLAAYEDYITMGTKPTTFTAGGNIHVTGGTTATPKFSAKNTSSPVDGGKKDGNVGLTFAGPLTSVSFTYGQNGTVYGDPFVGISDISFTYCK